MTYPEKRELTGAYIRIEREGKWQPIDIGDMTEEELRSFFKDREKENLISWIELLVLKLRQIGEELGIYSSNAEISQGKTDVLPSAPE